MAGEKFIALEETSQEIKTAVEGVKTDVAGVKTDVGNVDTNVDGVKTDTEGIVLSNASIKAIVDEIQSRIGLTADTGGSASAGSMMSKLNQIISAMASSGGGGWEIPSIKQLINDGTSLSDLNMQANTNYKLLAIPNYYTFYNPESSDNVYAGVEGTASALYFYINNIQTYSNGKRTEYFPLYVPFYFKISSTSTYKPEFYVKNCWLFWLND